MNLVMLTKFYPYGTGEAFIENEIEILSKYFEKILIIACEAPNTSNMRKVPENVTVRKVSGVGSKGKIWDTLKGQWNHIRPGDEFRLERKKCKTLTQRGYLGYFEGKCQRIYKTIKKENFLEKFTDDSFVLYSYWLYMTARISTYIQQDYRVRYSFSRAHSYDLYTERNPTKYLPFRELFLDAFDHVFPCSANGEHYLHKLYPKYKETVKAALLGTADHGVGQSSTDGIFRLVSCSRVSKEKRIERIIEALAILDKKHLYIEWTHIGGGGALESIKQKTEEKLETVRTVFYGDIPNNQVMELYKKRPFDVFINVSSSEGLPVSIMEAISFGMPVIATDVGGTSEIVNSGVTGTLIKEEFENEELAKAIEDFYYKKNSIEYQDYRQRCRSFWEEHFQAEKNYNELYSYIENVIKN